MFDLDAAQLERLNVDLRRAIENTPDKVRQAVQYEAFEIKRDAQRRVTGLAHAPAYPYAITYETRRTATGSEAVIGPDKNRAQGALGNLLEYGSVNNAPRPHLAPALIAAVPRFADAIGRIAAGEL